MEDFIYLQVINDFLEECYELRNGFTPDLDIQQESLDVSNIIERIKEFISNRFGSSSHYYRIINFPLEANYRIFLNEIIKKLKEIKNNLNLTVYGQFTSINSGLEYFEKRSDELIFAQFPGQYKPNPYQRTFEHGEQVPWDYGATGSKWDSNYNLYMSSSIYGEPINVIHKDGYTYIESGKINEPIVSKFKSDFLKGKFNRPATYGEWRVIAQLPQGGQAAVFKVKRDNEDTIYALKSFDIKSQESKKYKRYEHEVNCLKTLKDNDNVIKLVDEGGKVPFRGTNYYYYVMELADATLKDCVLNVIKLELEEKFNVFNEILDAFQSVHEKGFIHRDIKPQNLLIKNNKIKIADFGIVYHDDFSRITSNQEQVGARNYICPESEDGKANVDFRCDIYALGKILYYLLSNGEIFSREEEKFEQEEDFQLEAIHKNDKYKVFLPFFRKSITIKIENRYSSAIEMKNDLRTYIKQFYNE